MNIKRVSSTDLKTNTAEILNMVAYGGVEAIIERHGEELVRIVPMNIISPKKDYKALVDKYFGASPDFPEVHKKRTSSKHDLDW